jgi:crotonobetainyl-CoA:carnitine CoA-transferase CaiB-like acyl-CoA transferase
MDRPDLAADERFATREARHANRSEMMTVLQQFATTFDDFEEFEAALGTAKLAVGEMRPATDVGTAPWAKERDALVDVGADGAPLRLPRSPFRFSAASAGTAGRPAWQGEHNREVLREVLELSDAEVDQLEADGVLVSRRPPR